MWPCTYIHSACLFQWSSTVHRLLLTYGYCSNSSYNMMLLYINKTNMLVKKSYHRGSYTLLRSIHLRDLKYTFKVAYSCDKLATPGPQGPVVTSTYVCEWLNEWTEWVNTVFSPNIRHKLWPEKYLTWSQLELEWTRWPRVSSLSSSQQQGARLEP